MTFSASFRVATVHVKNGSSGSFESQLSLNFYSVSNVSRFTLNSIRWEVSESMLQIIYGFYGLMAKRINVRSYTPAIFNHYAIAHWCAPSTWQMGYRNLGKGLESPLAAWCVLPIVRNMVCLDNLWIVSELCMSWKRLKIISMHSYLSGESAVEHNVTYFWVSILRNVFSSRQKSPANVWNHKRLPFTSW